MVDVSVYVVSYNRSDKLRRCLNSILHQDFTGTFEIIVVDNNSSDGAQDVLKEYASKHNKIRCIFLSENLGACFARNEAIKSSNSKYITGSDDDDEWPADRLRKLSEAYSPELAFIYADDLFVDAHNKCKKTNKPSLIDFDQIKYQNDVGNQVYSERYKFIEAGLFDINLVSAQDYDMWFRMLEQWGSSRKVIGGEQKIYVSGEDRITASSKKKFGYFNFYKKHKNKLNLKQRKHQLLMIKYVCQEKIGFKMYARMFSLDYLKRKIAVFVRKVLLASKYKY